MHSHSQAEASPRSSLKRRLAPQQLIAGTHKRSSSTSPLQLRELESAHLRSRTTALHTGSLALKIRPAALLLLKVVRTVLPFMYYADPPAPISDNFKLAAM